MRTETHPPPTTGQRYFEDVVVGEEVPAVSYPLSVYRLVMAAGSNRDFNSIHHNTGYARASGAPDMYANTFMLLGMWERTVRDFIGLGGRIHSIKGFRMKRFNVVGDTTIVSGAVQRVWDEDGLGMVELSIRCENSLGITVGPGTVTVDLPKRKDAPQ